jgi:hypothetical protein
MVYTVHSHCLKRERLGYVKPVLTETEVGTGIYFF